MTNELEIMRSAGLTGAESAVYLALLELGSSTAGPAIKKTGMHRATVYDALRKLMEKGFASFVIKGKKKYFEAADPKAIITLEFPACSGQLWEGTGISGKKERKNSESGLIAYLTPA